MRLTNNIGFILLAIWLILVGIAEFVSLGNTGSLMNILALAAGVFILLGR